ncbi:SRPBCC family protein [Actinomycetospora termitidis]|uniref:SRPBCC family protein n=1 Tax=Actinomycetospora termitidis TaxID=3053470 RepID=A0ABT7M4R7_9PSEU|nr:SRPBCC family protein [Actinomycetospora sp. Odt1-22]MDL5154438.1 SRPBCC family protein [Actinomycetospora sp. Odt1-22]
MHHATRDIAAPLAEVWAVVEDVERWPEWTPTLRAATLLDPGPLRPGTRVRLDQPRLPTITWTVERVDEGRGFSWVSGGRLALSRGDHRLTATDSGTRVDLTFEQHGIAAVFGALTASMTRRYVETEAESLRRRCEA